MELDQLSKILILGLKKVIVNLTLVVILCWRETVVILTSIAFFFFRRRWRPFWRRLRVFEEYRFISVDEGNFYRTESVTSARSNDPIAKSHLIEQIQENVPTPCRDRLIFNLSASSDYVISSSSLTVFLYTSVRSSVRTRVAIWSPFLFSAGYHRVVLRYSRQKVSLHQYTLLTRVLRHVRGSRYSVRWTSQKLVKDALGLSRVMKMSWTARKDINALAAVQITTRTYDDSLEMKTSDIAILMKSFDLILILATYWRIRTQTSVYRVTNWTAQTLSKSIS